MTVPTLPTEIWIMIFERFDFPPQLSVIRRSRFDEVRTVTAMYETGQPQGVANLPEFERSKWMLMRRYYHTSKSLREAAARARFSQRWCESFLNVMHSEALERPKILATRRKKYSKVDLTLGNPQTFHGSQAPEYMAIHLYNRHPYYSGAEYYRQEMDYSKYSTLEFANAHPAFATLRRVDLIAWMPHEEAEKARRHVEKITSCIEKEWHRRGIRDGVLQVYYEPYTADLNNAHSAELILLGNLFIDEDCPRPGYI